MKYLKSFNESDSSSYYYEIPISEWNTLAGRFEYDIMNEKDISEIKKAIKYNPKSPIYRLKWRTTGDGRRIGIDIYSAKKDWLNDPIKEFKITKYTDEWYIVKMYQSDENSSNGFLLFGFRINPTPSIEKIFRCDQLEGLTKFLEDNT